MKENIFKNEERDFNKRFYTAQAVTMQPFSSDTALAILYALDKWEGVACVAEITTLVGMTQPTISAFLRLWLQLGILQKEKVGLYAFYSLNRLRLREVLQPFWDLCQEEDEGNS